MEDQNSAYFWEEQKELWRMAVTLGLPRDALGRQSNVG